MHIHTHSFSSQRLDKHSHKNLHTCWIPWSALQKKRGLWAREPVLTPVPSQEIYGSPRIAVGSRREKIVRNLHTVCDVFWSVTVWEPGSGHGNTKFEELFDTRRDGHNAELAGATTISDGKRSWVATPHGDRESHILRPWTSWT